MQQLPKATELATRLEATHAVVERVAADTSIRLAAMGFDGFSAKMLLSDVNDALTEEGLPVQHLRNLKVILTLLGYHSEEVAWHPLAGIKYSAWKRERK